MKNSKKKVVNEQKDEIKETKYLKEIILAIIILLLITFFFICIYKFGKFYTKFLISVRIIDLTLF